MRLDQLQKLQALSERLADVFITEADPDHWTGDGKLPADLSREERGDRLWDRKGAMATGGVLRYTLDLIGHHGKRIDAPGNPEDPAKESDLDGKIRRAEKEAAAAMDRVLTKAKAKVPSGAPR